MFFFLNGYLLLSSAEGCGNHCWFCSYPNKQTISYLDIGRDCEIIIGNMSMNYINCNQLISCNKTHHFNIMVINKINQMKSLMKYTGVKSRTV